MKRFKIKHIAYTILPYAALILTLCITLLPVASMVMSSLKSPRVSGKQSCDRIAGGGFFYSAVDSGGICVVQIQKKGQRSEVLYYFPAGAPDVSGRTAHYPAVSDLPEHWDYKHAAVGIYRIFYIYTAFEYLDDAELF